MSCHSCTPPHIIMPYTYLQWNTWLTDDIMQMDLVIGISEQGYKALVEKFPSEVIRPGWIRAFAPHQGAHITSWEVIGHRIASAKQVSITPAEFKVVVEVRIKVVYDDDFLNQYYKESTMLEELIRLYTAYMYQDVRSPIPHLAGPPGVGKSEVAEQLAALTGKQLHIVNVSRISPLEIEGVQMPHGVGEEQALKLLHNPLWKNLQHGDIILLDEFLRGFPEVYNGLLDIFTSRQVAGFELPQVFILAASNSVSTYDPALEDRLLHLYVPDIRSNKIARRKTKELIVRELNLHKDLVDSSDMETLLVQEVDPMYEILDVFKRKKRSGTTTLNGSSVRNLIGQARLRKITSTSLKAMLDYNNQLAESQQKYQYYCHWKTTPMPQKVYDATKDMLSDPAILKRLSESMIASMRLNIAFSDMATERARAAAEADVPIGKEEEDEMFI